MVLGGADSDHSANAVSLRGSDGAPAVTVGALHLGDQPQGLEVMLLGGIGFEPAVPLLDWFTWSIFCNLLGWPLGFWVMARRSKRAIALFQGLLSVAMFLLAAWLVPRWGVKGAAIAFFGAAVIYTLILLAMVRWISGAWFSAKTSLWAALGAGVMLTATKVSMTKWGLLLLLAVSTCCVFIYLRAMRLSAEDEP